MKKSWLSSIILAALVAGAAAAQGAAPVYCGAVTCFEFHVSAAGKDPDSRANAAMDVINKYLGGSVGKVTTRPEGKNVGVYLNKELVALVTPADAAAEKQKSAVSRAERWGKALSAAFEQTKATK